MIVYIINIYYIFVYTFSPSSLPVLSLVAACCSALFAGVYLLWTSHSPTTTTSTSITKATTPLTDTNGISSRDVKDVYNSNSSTGSEKGHNYERKAK